MTLLEQNNMGENTVEAVFFQTLPLQLEETALVASSGWWNDILQNLSMKSTKIRP